MNSTSNGIGICGVLFIVFLILKLVNVVKWSWWIVFSPILFEVGLVLLILLWLWINNHDIWRY